MFSQALKINFDIITQIILASLDKEDYFFCTHTSI